MKIDVKRSWSRWSQSDWTLVSEGPARPVSCNSEDVGVGQMTGRWVAQRPDASKLCSVMLMWQHRGRHHMTRRWLCPVKHDRTRPVVKYHFWNLTANDRMLEAQSLVSCSGASGQQMTVEIRRLLLNAV